MGPTWVLSAPDGPHVGPTNLAIRDEFPTNSGDLFTQIQPPQLHPSTTIPAWAWAWHSEYSVKYDGYALTYFPIVWLLSVLCGVMWCIKPYYLWLLQCHCPIASEVSLKGVGKIRQYLSQCGLTTPYDDITLSQHWLRNVACCLTVPSHHLNQC